MSKLIASAHTSVKHANAALKGPNVDIESSCEPFLRHTIRDSSLHHVVLLDGCQTADAFVVSVILVVSRDEALNFCFTDILENLDAQMTVQKEVTVGWIMVTSDYRQLDQADLCN